MTRMRCAGIEWLLRGSNFSQSIEESEDWCGGFPGTPNLRSSFPKAGQGQGKALTLGFQTTFGKRPECVKPSECSTQIKRGKAPKRR